jgi:hypothetical protein
MPATSLIQRFDTLLYILYRSGFESSGDCMANARINFSISENGRCMYEERLEHMVLRDSVEDGEMLGAELDDGHCFAVVACDFSSHTELGCVVDSGFENRNCGAR